MNLFFQWMWSVIYILSAVQFCATFNATTGPLINGRCFSTQQTQKTLQRIESKTLPFLKNGCLQPQGCTHYSSRVIVLNQTFRVCECCPRYIGTCGSRCKPVCLKQCHFGDCIQPDTCACYLGYIGPVCNVPVCSPLCANGGICERPNRCRCQPNFTGLHCQFEVEEQVAESTPSYVIILAVAVPLFVIVVFLVAVFLFVHTTRKKLQNETKAALALLGNMPSSAQKGGFEPIRKSSKKRGNGQYDGEYGIHSEYGNEYGGYEVEYLYELANKKAKTKEINNQQLEERQAIHEGPQFVVSRATYYPKKGPCRDVVTKRVRLVHQIPQEYLNSLNDKILLLSLLPTHQNIVRFIGKCGLMEDASLGMVLEYCDVGPLSVWLDERQRLPDSRKSYLAPQLHDFCFQIALGLRHLHRNNVLHRKLGARQILLKSDRGGRELVCKVTGLGCDGQDPKIPKKWLPPEVIKDRQYSLATDYWSYGICIWELYSLGEQPFHNVANEDVLRVLLNGKRPLKPALCSLDVYERVLRSTWESDPDKRPDFDRLLNRLRELSPNRPHSVASNDAFENDVYI